MISIEININKYTRASKTGERHECLFTSTEIITGNGCKIIPNWLSERDKIDLDEVSKILGEFFNTENDFYLTLKNQYYDTANHTFEAQAFIGTEKDNTFQLSQKMAYSLSKEICKHIDFDVVSFTKILSEYKDKLQSL